MEKNICVMDTNSIIISHYFDYKDLTIGGRTFLEEFSDKFKKHTPDYIFRKELRTALSGYEVDFREDVIKKVSLDFYKDIYDYSMCNIFISWWLSNKHIKINSGEQYCLSLATLLSKKYNTFVYIISDDTRAIDTLKAFMVEQRIGYVYSTPDILAIMYSHKNAIREEQVMMLLQEYRRVALGDFDYAGFRDGLSSLCRIKGIDKRYCKQECYMK